MFLFCISVKAVVTENEYLHTEAVAEEFMNGIGKDLQGKLIERSKEHRNWVIYLFDL